MISAIIPARNEEENIARVVRSLAAQPEVAEIIVVNDQSTDRTGALLQGLVQEIPQLRALETRELPAGWTGKNYALSIGAAVATQEWLLFADADTFHLPGAMRRALADAVDHDAVLVSYSPEQEMGSYWERALIPFVFCRLAAKYSFARVNNPRLPDAAANGQFLMVLRDVYEAIGGHAAVAPQILEDVALARRVKQAGYFIYFSAPFGVVRTHMYRSFRVMWQGWTKNLYLVMGGTPGSLLLELAEVVPWSEAVLLFILWHFTIGKHASSIWLLSLCAVFAIVGRLLRYGVELYRNLYPVSFIQYYVPAVILYLFALLASAWKNWRGAVVWKGREYPAAMS